MADERKLGSGQGELSLGGGVCLGKEKVKASGCCFQIRLRGVVLRPDYAPIAPGGLV